VVKKDVVTKGRETILAFDNTLNRLKQMARQRLDLPIVLFSNDELNTLSGAENDRY